MKKNKKKHPFKEDQVLEVASDEATPAVPEAETAVEEGMETAFKIKPTTFEGELYTSLNLDFEKLTGLDIEKAEMQFLAESPNNQIIMVKEMSKPFAAIVAAKASGVNVGLIRALTGPDYSKITMRTTLFLMNGK
ncbi:MAG: hypothetical protein ABS948_11860 [Solibacillus sp.]